MCAQQPEYGYAPSNKQGTNYTRACAIEQTILARGAKHEPGLLSYCYAMPDGLVVYVSYSDGKLRGPAYDAAGFRVDVDLNLTEFKRRYPIIRR